MTPNAYDLWSAQYPEAAAALRAITVPPPPPPGQGSEQRIQSAVRLEAARKGYTLWRNNVGVLLDKRGVPLRYGLANDSAAVNGIFKSADLIGWDASGRFVSIEVKADKGRVHPAQENWANLVNSRGGLGLIINQEGMLP